jgi:hypothetical protein
MLTYLVEDHKVNIPNSPFQVIFQNSLGKKLDKMTPVVLKYKN